MEEGTRPHYSFWQFNVGHLMTLLGLVGAFIWWFIVYDRQINANTMLAAVNADKIKTMELRIEVLDREGTQAGRRRDENEDAILARDNQRIEVVEQTLKELMPKMTRIEIKLEDVSDWVRDQGQKPAKGKKE